MRIVGGAHRGRRIAAPPGEAVRPTADRVREALFSMLQSGRYGGERVAGAHVLDAFAGSGALGLEALSRGAAHCTFMDSAGPSVAAVKANLRTLGLAAHARVLRCDATRPPRASAPCDLILLDPPYGSGLVPESLAALAQADWCAEDALVAVEHATRSPVAPPDGFTAETARTYGRTGLVLLRRSPAGR